MQLSQYMCPAIPILNQNSEQAQGLLYWWPLSVVSHYNIGSRFKDMVNYGQDYAFYPQVWGGLGSDALLGYGTYYDGSNVGNPNVVNTSFNLSAPFTLSLWCRSDFANGTGNQSFAKIFGKPHNALSETDPYYLWLIQIDNGSPATFVGYISTGVAGGGVSIGGTSTLASGKVWHVALTYDGATLALYVNGLLESSTATSITVGTNSNQPTMGKGPRNNAENWLGLIKDVRVYNTAKSPGEIWRMYDAETRWELYTPQRRRRSFKAGASTPASSSAAGLGRFFFGSR